MEKAIINAPLDTFKVLSKGIYFEDVCKGRKGAVLVEYDKNKGIPLVRTTTKYHRPAQIFHQSHLDIISLIQNQISSNIQLNNCLIEIYDKHYTKMGYHTDQAQDLVEGSFICVFSCYENEEESNLRRLDIIPKDATGTTGTLQKGNGKVELMMSPNSVIFWTTQTNREFKHKIVLNYPQKSCDRWLGMTLRFSKTYISPEKPLTLATPEQRKEFYALRRRENEEIDFEWPELCFTISPSDIMEVMEVVMEVELDNHLDLN